MRIYPQTNRPGQWAILAALALGVCSGCDSRTKLSTSSSSPELTAQTELTSQRSDPLAGAGAIREYAGTYSVAEVLEGQHTRGSVTIEADGSVDFDDGIRFAKALFSKADDNRKRNGCLTVESTGGVEGQKSRLDILVNAASGMPESMRYLPSMEGAEGLVEIVLGAAEIKNTGNIL